MASVILNGDTSGTVTLSAPAVAGSSTQTLVAATGTLAPIVSGTAVASTSGTSIDFTGIPSWVKRITVMLSGVSTNGSSPVLIQLGTPTFATSGYLGTTTIVASGVITLNLSTGFQLYFQVGDASTAVRHGKITIENLSNNTWVASAIVGLSSSAYSNYMGGSLALGSTLSAVRITTVNGTDTFDAGSINIMYE